MLGALYQCLLSPPPSLCPLSVSVFSYLLANSRLRKSDSGAGLFLINFYPAFSCMSETRGVFPREKICVKV